MENCLKNMSKSSFFKALIFFGSILFLTSCLSNVELQDEVKAKENQTQILDYFTKLGVIPVALDNGAFFTVTKTNSTGEIASRGDSLFVHYELSNLNTGKVLDSTNRQINAPYIYRYGLTNPVFAKLMGFLKEGEQATMIMPGTSQAFDGLPAYTPLKCVIKQYKVRSQSDKIDEFIASKGWVVTEKSTDGLRFIRTAVGTGDLGVSGKIMMMKYTGRFLNGVAFDGNMAKTDTFSVTFGGTQTVQGFQRGIEKMRTGEKAVVVFPSTLGYGEKGSSSIPGFTPLVFELYVAKIK
ncbi:FKBP-type peptidyl-prolyl cis-trans isomerase [Aquirufa sp. ROCK-SH2]